MAGVLFIVNIPQKEYEFDLRKKEKAKTLLQKQNVENASQIVNELKKNKEFGSFKLNLESNVNEIDGLAKSKSTDCLQVPNEPEGMSKSKSETRLNDVSFVSEGRSRRRSSLADMKQALSPWKTRVKVSISQPRRSVDIAAAFHVDTPLETILLEIITRLDIKSAAWNTSRDNTFWKVMLTLKSGDLSEELLQVLRTFGIGSRFQSSISVIPSALYYKSEENTINEENFINLSTQGQPTNSGWSRFSSSVKARDNLAKVLHNVRSEAALTFDWIFLLVVAAFVAALGLVENSTVILVSSMLISPLMGPITAGTLGIAVHDRSLKNMGIMHELLGLLLSLIIGFIFGLIICSFEEHYGTGDWPTYEMISRGELRALWVGLLVAIPSGAGAALAVLGDNTPSLVGVAISVSLLPPAVNAGLLWAISLMHLIFIDDKTRWVSVVKTSYYSTDHATELAVLGFISLCLTLVNILFIVVAGVIVYKVKGVHPLESKDIAWWKANRELMKAWNMYSDWSPGKNMPDDNAESVYNPADDTRSTPDFPSYRSTPDFRRVRTPNIDTFGRKQRIPDSFFTLSEENDDNSRNQTENKDNIRSRGNHRKSSSLEIASTISVFDSSFSDIDTCDDTNKAQQECKHNNNITNHPTLEPSSNRTVNVNNFSILAGKSYHV